MSKKKKSGSKGIVIAIGVVIAVVIAIILVLSFSGGDKYPRAELDKFAKCLTDNGAVMYGAFWCPHCARTKKNFGSSFQYIKYVECDPRGENEQSQLCLDKEIDKYDTWEFADGSRIISEPTFEQLSEKSGCPMPKKI